jgi:hypothetical protein
MSLDIYEVESTRKKNVGMIIQADVEAWIKRHTAKGYSVREEDI